MALGTSDELPANSIFVAAILRITQKALQGEPDKVLEKGLALKVLGHYFTFLESSEYLILSIAGALGKDL
jgi:hypothetical protein